MPANLLLTAPRPARIPETQILRETLVLLSALRIPGEPKIPACRVWRQQVGTFRQLYSEAKIKVGTEGMADIGGLLHGGRALQIEMKAEGGQLSEAQRNWREMVLSFGGLYFVARSPGFAVAAVLEALGYPPSPPTGGGA
jgi:hypothetical protein